MAESVKQGLFPLCVLYDGSLNKLLSRNLVLAEETNEVGHQKR